MTDRLYYSDSYATAFEARVDSVSDAGVRVYLDRTAFYPTSGGQPNDRGTLDGRAVVDVVDEGERIAHILAEPLTAMPGEAVVGSIDWPRRFDHMQQHTGQHLLSALFAEMLGLPTVSVHFGDDVSTLDLRTPSIAPERMVEVEARANALIVEDLPVTVHFEAASEATGLRKPSDREGDLRVITIGDLDRSACGGTHVRRTGEIGLILLRRMEEIRGDTRVEFLCGARAVRRARADYDALAAAGRELAAALEDVPALVAGTKQQLREAQQAARRQQEELAGHRARDLWDRTPADATGIRRIVLRNASWSADELRVLAQAMATLPRTILIAATDSPPTILLASSEDSGVEAGATLRAALNVVGGRGGGSARIAQGTVPGVEAVSSVLAALGRGEV